MKLPYSGYILLIVLCCVGCTPKIPGADIPPTPIAWKLQFDRNVLFSSKNIDPTGNAFVVDTYFDSTVENIAFGLKKVDTKGTTLWHTTGFIEIDGTGFNSEMLKEAKLLFDSLGNTFIVGVVAGYPPNYGGSALNYAVFIAKIQSDGTISWQTKHAPGSVGKRSSIRLRSAVVSGIDTLYLAIDQQSSVDIITYDALGNNRTIYSQTPALFGPSDAKSLFKGAADGSLYFYHDFAPAIDATVPPERRFIQLSPTGQILQNFRYVGLVGDFVVNPDATIYILHSSSVKRYALSGTLLWERDIQIPSETQCETRYFPRKGLLSSDATVNIAYEYSCATVIGGSEEAGYSIVQLTTTGEEVRRIGRKLPTNSNNNGTPFFPVQGMALADFQIDEFDNLLIMEQIVTGGILVHLYPLTTEFMISTMLTRKIDPAGNLVAQSNTRTYRTKTDAAIEGTPLDGPFHVNDDGSVTLFVRQRYSDAYMILNHAGIF